MQLRERKRRAISGIPVLFHPLFLYIPLLFLLSCEKEEGVCFQGHGPQSSEERDVSGLRAIELHDHIHLKVSVGTREKLTVKGGKKLLPGIRTEMRGDTLRIRDMNRCHWTRSYEKKVTVKLTVKKLEALINRSTADIDLKGPLQGERFDYDQWNGMGEVRIRSEADTLVLKQHTGAADLFVSGSCKRAELFCAGTGFMYLRDLKAGSVWAHNDATGNIEVHVEEHLGALVESMGSVLYKGPGALGHSEQKGSGQVKRID